MAAFLAAMAKYPVTVRPLVGERLPIEYPYLESLDLSPWLVKRLEQWQVDFESNFDQIAGWKLVEARDVWRREGSRLVDELRGVVPEGVEVEGHFTP